MLGPSIEPLLASELSSVGTSGFDPLGREPLAQCLAYPCALGWGSCSVLSIIVVPAWEFHSFIHSFLLGAFPWTLTISFLFLGRFN